MLKTDVKPLFFLELHHLNKDGKAHETLQTILPATVNEGENISIAVDLGQLVDHQRLRLKVALDIYTYVYPCIPMRITVHCPCFSFYSLNFN